MNRKAEIAREYARLTRLAFPEKQSAVDQRYRARHFEEWTARNRANVLRCQKANPTPHRKSCALYQRSPKGKANRARFFATEKGKAHRRANDVLRRARKKLATINADLKAVKEFYFNLETADLIFCHWCKEFVAKEERHGDHRIPISKGGEHSAKNLVPSCSFCNLSKGSKLPEEFQAKKIGGSDA